MGTTFQSDIPGNKNLSVITVASVASDGADTLHQPLFRVPQPMTLQAAYWMASASQNTGAASSAYRVLKVINLGAAAAGTVVLASISLATLTRAANVPHAMTLNTTAANLELAAGDLLSYLTTIAAGGVAVVAAAVQIEARMN